MAGNFYSLALILMRLRLPADLELVLTARLITKVTARELH